MNKTEKEIYEESAQHLNDLHEKFSNSSNDELNKMMIEVERINYDKLSNNHTDFKKSNSLFIAILIIILVCLGLFNFSIFPAYYFGMAFFLAGVFFGMKAKGMGIIFLFSHGMTGLALMSFALLNNKINSIILSDCTSNIYVYIGLIIALILAATIYVILYNLNIKVREIKNSQEIPFLLYTIAIGLIAVFPKILVYLNNLNLFN